MGDLIIPNVSAGLRGRFGAFVTSDVFHIAERLQEVDRRLFVEAYDEPLEWHGRTYNFVITEYVPVLDEYQLVMRVEHLDARVIDRVERMRRIPFAQRFAEAEKAEARWAEEDKQRQLDELYENMGGNMLIQLDRCGFIDRPVSYAKVNRTAQRHRGARKVVLPAGVSA